VCGKKSFALSLALDIKDGGARACGADLLINIFQRPTLFARRFVEIIPPVRISSLFLSAPDRDDIEKFQSLLFHCRGARNNFGLDQFAMLLVGSKDARLKGSLRLRETLSLPAPPPAVSSVRKLRNQPHLTFLGGSAKYFFTTEAPFLFTIFIAFISKVKLL